MMLFPLLVLTICVLVEGKAFYANRKDLIEGDILLSEQDKLDRQLPSNVRMHLFAKDYGRNRWPDNTMSYTISDDFSQQEKDHIRKALKELEERSCFRFPERTTEEDYAEYKRDANKGCESYIGRIGGPQAIFMAPQCFNDLRTAQHETMHALGVHHEHVRPDRDDYIDVVRENIEEYETNKRIFEKADMTYFEQTGLPYDIKSVMQYHGQSFGKIEDGRQLVTLRIKGTNDAVPYNSELSEIDVKKLAALGNCPAPTLPKSSKTPAKSTKSKNKKNKKKVNTRKQRNTKKKTQAGKGKKKANNSKSRRPSKRIQIENLVVN